MTFRSDRTPDTQRRRVYVDNGLVRRPINEPYSIVMLQPKRTARESLGRTYPNRLATVLKSYMEAYDVASSEDLYAYGEVNITNYGKVKDLFAKSNAIAGSWHIRSASVSGLLLSKSFLISDKNISAKWVAGGTRIDCGGELRAKIVTSDGPIIAKKIIIKGGGSIRAYNSDTREQFPIIAEEISPTNCIQKGKGYFVSTKSME